MGDFMLVLPRTFEREKTGGRRGARPDCERLLRPGEEVSSLRERCRPEG